MATTNRFATLVLIGCSKTKRPYTYDRRRGGRITPTEMYGGQLFQKRVAYAEGRSLPWAVLSAHYGLWWPNREMRPYEATMTSKLPAEVAVWHASVAQAVVEHLWEPYDLGLLAGPMRPNAMTVEIHAGRDYAHPLAELLTTLGFRVSCPCEGLGIGQQLALYTTGVLSSEVVSHERC